MLLKKGPVSPNRVYVHQSPGLLLGACVVLGCCLSSYYQRRREQDTYLTLVFLAWIALVVCVARGAGSSADIAMLGMVPWALCAAMLSSSMLHVVLGWLTDKGNRAEGCVDEFQGDEKGEEAPLSGT
jgi:predicted MFS family arabinose efflux permease